MDNPGSDLGGTEEHVSQPASSESRDFSEFVGALEYSSIFVTIRIVPALKEIASEDEFRSFFDYCVERATVEGSKIDDLGGVDMRKRVFKVFSDRIYRYFYGSLGNRSAQSNRNYKKERIWSEWLLAVSEDIDLDEEGDQTIILPVIPSEKFL